MASLEANVSALRTEVKEDIESLKDEIRELKAIMAPLVGDARAGQRIMEWVKVGAAWSAIIGACIVALNYILNHRGG